MAYRENLQTWVREALIAIGGRGTVVEVAKHLWENHQADFLAAGEGFYTWQYDMRWAAQRLREQGKLGLTKEGSKSVWYTR